MAEPAAWRVAAASVTGTSHQAAGRPCQDNHAWQRRADGTLLAAVADGAGSAARSDEGSHLAVTVALAALDAALAEGLPQDAAEWQRVLAATFHAARTALEALAEAAGAPLRDFATTLSCAVVSVDWLAVGQNGDGAVVAADDSGALWVVVPPARGEYANEVAFLTAPDGLEHVVTVAEPAGDLSALALSTDGLLRLALVWPELSPHAGFFDPLWAFLRAAADEPAGMAALAEFLASPRVAERSDDDLTLVLLVRQDPPAAP